MGREPSWFQWLYNLSVIPHLFEKGYKVLLHIDRFYQKELVESRNTSEGEIKIRLFITLILGLLALFRHFHDSKFSKTGQQRISSQMLPTKEGVRKSILKAILDKGLA
ncbi:MAG: hypothetical protein EAZ39_21600 [Oscillatoriales cyanobacterium]|nr:MAG: hypothetical protein EAZ45_16900 [Oscillatoriales cyanobacterium]TAG15316.1 MAG: hypothetical protein EAZ39_21600 [Oscillatoriales cyanobacterium]TAG33944.1 MAG: hypothetical protein EAZ33_28775 [Oscillatoriales cyanobacterium]TAG63746.1 MAG: hypothetical protein EAZ25_23420 [Oscillatoriales cyanobacterium]